MARYFTAYYNAGTGLYEAVNGPNADKSFNAVSGSDANGLAAILLAKSGKFISFPVDGVGAAAITTACVNSDSNITYTAKTVGPNGTSIRVRYVVAGNNTALSVSVSGNDITVNVATNAGGSPTSTATLIKAAVDGNGSSCCSNDRCHESGGGYAKRSRRIPLYRDADSPIRKSP
jgi:hypothetical protein